MNNLKLLWELSRLNANPSRTREEILEIQEKKLRRLLAYAWENSPWHRRRFLAAGITAETVGETPLSQFPTMDKARLLTHFDEIVTVPGVTQEAIRAFDAAETSGSTGSPGYFLYDQPAWEQMLLGIVRGALWGMSAFQIARLLAGRPHILYIAAIDRRYGGAMAVEDGIAGVGVRQLYLDIKAPLSQWVRRVQEYRPNFIIGYPSAIKILAELAQPGAEHEPIRRELERQMAAILLEKGLSYVAFQVIFTGEIHPAPRTGKKTLILPMERRECAAG